MRKTKFTDEQIAFALKQAELGTPVAEIIHKMGITEQSFYRWKRKFGGMMPSDVRFQWAYGHQIKLAFSRPGKPTDNALIESLNGRFRDECLNVNWFLSLEDARQKNEAWRLGYDDWRPHSALGNQTPSKFAAQALSEAV